MADDYPHALPAGCRLGDYRIEAVIGHGGFGITYRAIDTTLGKTVAIKEYLPVEFAVRAEGETVRPRGPGMAEDFRWGLERFLDEARTLARFRHPNLVPVLRYFEGNGTGYMVMEHEAGASLADRLARGGPLPEPEVRRLLDGLLDGLEEVHAAGYLHRDVKPANIVLKRDGSPVLLDFGAARQALGAKGRTMTSIVTPRYAPLEQYALDGEQGPWSDVYGLAAVAYHAISGAPPPEAVSRLRSDPYEALAPRFADRYDRRLLEAIDWGLTVHAEDRPRRIADWRRWMGGADGNAASDGAAPDEAATRKIDAPLTGLIARSAGGGRVEPRLGGAAPPADSRGTLSAAPDAGSREPSLGRAPPSPTDTGRVEPLRIEPDEESPSRRGERRPKRLPRLARIALFVLAVSAIGLVVREVRRSTAPKQPDIAVTQPPQSQDPAKPEPATSPQAVETPPPRPGPDPTPIRPRPEPAKPPVSTTPATTPAKPAQARAAVVEARRRAMEQAQAAQAQGVSAEKEAQKRAARAAERAGEARIAAAEAARPDLADAQRSVYADGVVYVGQMKDGKREGYGVAEFPTGERQAGQWKDDKLDGLAVLTLRDGRRYEGEWDDGAPKGLGVLIDSAGRSEGEIERGRQDGFAVRTAGGGIEAGEWKNHALDGAGVEAPPGGARYEGEFRAGKRHGQGVLRLPGGDTFHGAFADGKRDGYGVETDASGAPIRSGVWSGDALVRPEE